MICTQYTQSVHQFLRMPLTLPTSNHHHNPLSLLHPLQICIPAPRSSFLAMHHLTVSTWTPRIGTPQTKAHSSNPMRLGLSAETATSQSQTPQIYSQTQLGITPFWEGLLERFNAQRARSRAVMSSRPQLRQPLLRQLRKRQPATPLLLANVTLL